MSIMLDREIELLIEQDKEKLVDYLNQLDLELTDRHYGPGPHPGTGTEQAVHAGDRAVNGDGRDYEWIPTLKEDQEDIRNRPLEWGFFYGKNGVKYEIGSGDRYGITIPFEIEKILDDLEGRGIDTMMIHNHPGGGTFSVEDIGYSMKHGVDEVRVISPKGINYIMKIDSGSISYELFQTLTMADYYARVDEMHDSEFIALPPAERTKENTNIIYPRAAHRAWTEIADLYDGLEYIVEQVE